MAKTNFLSNLKGKVAPDLAAKLTSELSSWRSKRDEAVRRHEKAAYDFEGQVPGAGDRLAQAIEDRQEADAAIARVEAALRVQERLDGEARARAQAAAEAKQDKATRAEFDKLALIAGEVEEQAAAYAKGYERLLAQHRVCLDALTVNEGARQDLGYFSLFDAVGRELARITDARVPGANVLARQSSNPDEWPSLRQAFADLAAAIFPSVGKAA